jgi:hypothetical protein
MDDGMITQSLNKLGEESMTGKAIVGGAEIFNQ